MIHALVPLQSMDSPTELRRVLEVLPDVALETIHSGKVVSSIECHTLGTATFAGPARFMVALCRDGS